MFLAKAIQEFGRKIFGYEDYYELFDGYFSQLKRGENASLDGFTNFVRSSKGKNNRTFHVGTIIVNVFGFLGAQRLKPIPLSLSTRSLTSRNDSLFQAYARQIEQISNDALLTLQYNLGDIRQKKLSPTLLPQDVHYSWGAKKSTSVTASMDHIRVNLVRFFTLHPFPDRLMRVLGMNDIDIVATAIGRRREDLRLLVGSIFSVLGNSPGMPLVLPFSDEELLLKNGAFATYSEEERQFGDGSTSAFRSVFVFSFVDEIIEWVKEYCDNPTKRAWKTTLKVSGLVGISPTSQAHPYIQSTKPILLSLTPTSCSSSHSIEVEDSSDSSFCPFQDFLVHRTINTLFPPDIPRIAIIRQELFELFKASESTRVDFLFFWQVLHSLFIELDREIHPSLKSLIEAVLPLSDQMNSYQRACLIRDRIFPEAALMPPPMVSSSSSRHSVSQGSGGVEYERGRKINVLASVLLNCFILEYFVVKNIDPKGKADLIHWLYRHLNYPQKSNRNIWKELLSSKLPKSCLQQLQLHRRYDYEESCFLCAWDLLCLSSIDKDPHFDLIESCFMDLHFDLKFRTASCHDEGTLTPVKRLVMRGRDLLRIHQFGPEHPKYDLMDSILCLLICREFMNLSHAAENFLFERLLSVTADCRAKSIEEILQFTKHPNPLVLRERMIRNIWKEKMGEAAFSHYVYPFQWVDFQLEVLRWIESITGQQVPPITILIVFLYCFYVPIMEEEGVPFTPTLIEKLRSIATLRKTNFAKSDSLFLNPVQINEIQKLTRCLLDSNLVIPIESYTNEPHRQCLQYHQGGLLGGVQDVLIPNISFREPFIELATALLDPKERENLHIRQGLVYFDGKEQHYRNVVTTKMATETTEEVFEFTHKTYLGEWQSALYMPRWIEGEGGRLTFEMVFWRSINQLDSQSFQIQFGYTIDELSQILLKPLPKKAKAVSIEDPSSQPVQQMSSSLASVTLNVGSSTDFIAPARTSSAPVLRFTSGNQRPENSMSRFFSLWNTMIESAIELHAEEYEGQLQSFENEEQERLFCLSPYVDVMIREKWDAFLEGGEECERIAKDLFKFVKELKIKTRHTLASLYELRNLSQSHLDDIQQPFPTRDLVLGGGGEPSRHHSPSLSQLCLLLPKSSSMKNLLSFPIINLKGELFCANDPAEIPLDKDEGEIMLRRLESFSKDCCSSSSPQQIFICQIVGHKGIWNLTLSFNSMRPCRDNGSSSHDMGSSSTSSSSSSIEEMEPEPESHHLPEFTASFSLADSSGDSLARKYSFKLGDLLSHPRAHFLLKWLVDTLYHRHVREL